MTVANESQDLTMEPGEVDQLQSVEVPSENGEESTETESTDSPETTETESEETEATEGDSETEEAETDAEESESEAEPGTDETWLPDEQAKQFPLEVLADYAKRRGYKWTQDQIAQSADLQKLLKDKLNTDIYVKSLEQDSTATDLDENQFDEAEPAETAETKETPAAQTDARTAHYARVDEIVTKQIDQQAISELGKGLLDAMGVQTDTAKLQQMLANPKLSPEQRAEVQGALGLAQNAAKIGQIIARGGVDLITSLMPKILPDLIEQQFPGTKQNYEVAVYRSASSSAWDSLRGAKTQSGAQPYKDLPAFGTPEFGSLVRSAEKKLGLPPDGLSELVFKGTSASDPKAVQAAARRAYQMVARVAKGQTVTPATVKQAVETGKRQATESAQRRQAGRAMGSGLTSKALGNQAEDDDILSALKNQIESSNVTWDAEVKKKKA